MTTTPQTPTATWSEVAEQARLVLALHISGIKVPGFLSRASVYVSRRIMGRTYLAERRAQDARHDQWKALDASVDQWAAEHGIDEAAANAAHALTTAMLPAMHSGTLGDMRVTTGREFTVTSTLAGRVLCASIQPDGDGFNASTLIVPSRDEFESATTTKVGDIATSLYAVIGASLRR